MKIVILEYLAALRERDELDAVLPDLLTELGFTVYSRPKRGTRQHGVDVAAVGVGADGVRRVHLFSIKSGNLDRKDWNTDSPQSLRPSLDEILDVYVNCRIPPEYADLPIAICLCFGGAIDEHVRADVTGYMKRNTNSKIHYEEWNGDRLAQVILDGILREELLRSPLRSHLRKAVAMVEEPDISIDHFKRLLRALVAKPGETPAARLSQARLINICIWIMFAWSREIDNVEAPYRASEYALLEIWHLLRGDIARSTPSGEAASFILNELFELHFTIWRELFERKILPHTRVRHAISSAVASHAAIDINLKLFDVLGRLALNGLWLVWEISPVSGPSLLDDNYLLSKPKSLKAYFSGVITQIDRLCDSLIDMINNNPVLLSPVGDWQAIDIGLALTLLACRKKYHEVIDEWVKALATRSMFAFKTHGAYPVTSDSYWDLVEHPVERSSEYRTEMTQGSILYPMLALWAGARGQREIVDELASFKVEELEHCNFQAWMPDADSEESIYLGCENHGSALSDIPVLKGSDETLSFVLHEMSHNTHFESLSAVRFGHWPVVLMACRAYRLPIPPQIWRLLIIAVKKS